MSHPLQQERREAGPRQIAFVAWFTLLYALAIGFRNGGGDHPAYLPFGLRLADPSFLPGDWFTWETPHSHYAFGVIVAGIAKTGLLELGLTLGALIQSCGFALFLFLAVRAVYDKPLVPWAIALMLAASNGLIDPAGPMLIPKEFSATGLAGAATVAGLALLLMDRPAWAGVGMGLAGLVHALYGVLLTPVVGVVALTLWSKGRSREGLVLGAIFAVLASPTVVRALSFGSTPGVEEAQEIAREIFAVHLVPASWNPGVYLPFLGALLLGAAGLVTRPPRLTKAFQAAAATIALLVFVSLPLGYFDAGGISTIWPWRLAPLLTLMGLVSASAAVSRPDLFALRSPLKVAVVIALLVAGATMYGRQVDRFALLTVAIGAASPFVILLGSGTEKQMFRGPAASMSLLFVLITIGFVPESMRGVGDSNYRIRADDDLAPLLEWISTSTRPESVFATPPAMGEFRLAAGRPTVGDMVATPWYPPARIAWRQRIRDLTGVESLSDWAALNEGFLTIGCDRAMRLRRLYRVDYVLLGVGNELDCGVVAYSDGYYSVTDLRGVEARP